MNTDANPTSNSRILPFFMVILALTGAYFLNFRKVRSFSNQRKGGWSKKKIQAYNEKTGSRLKHGVDRDPKTLSDLKRKGSWATRHYKRKNATGLNQARLKDEKGELTPFSTQAIAWGEKPPKTRKDQKKLVKLGEKLLKTYHKFKEMGLKPNSVLPESVRNQFRKGLRKKV